MRISTHLIEPSSTEFEFTFQHDAELGPCRRSRHVRWVLDVAEVRAVVAKLSRIQLYGGVPLVYVPDELNSFLELNMPHEFLPAGEVENLERRGNTLEGDNIGSCGSGLISEIM